MENIVKLNEAFHNFTRASKSLETYYKKLAEKVQYLTQELEEKNAQLKAAIQQVQESKDYLHTVIQSIGEAIIVLDQSEKITMINRAARHLLRLGSKDVSGVAFNDLNCKIKKSASGTELIVKRKKYDVIISRSEVTDSEGTIRGYVILIKDITRLRELERQQERNQRLISMGEMAAKIVHEIRSPLCSIELFSNMLSKDLEGTPHSEMARGISNSIKSLNNILTNMLLFARPQKLSFKEIILKDTVEESIKMLIPIIEVRGIKLYTKLSDEVIEGDSELLKQVFMNVILNAIQAMSDGGKLEIKMNKNKDSVIVAVIDEGEGIDPENMEKIFDPFFSTKERGTGLGLAIAHKIMQGHNGFIKAERNKDKGSTFYLCFPYKKTVSTVQTVQAVQTVEKS
jgi:PAS domain S-box-containing protein